jgi:uncharacterized Tic20 family protein
MTDNFDPNNPASTPPPPPAGDPAGVPPPPPAAGAPIPATPISAYDTSGAPSGEIEMNKDARMWGMLCHLSALVALMGIPSIVGPLVIWLIKKNDYPFVDDQGKEAINFHLTVLIASIISAVLACIGIGIILLIAVGIVAIIFSIIAAVQANSGIRYRYPMTLRMIS